MGGGRDEHASLLAHHYAEAVRPTDVDVAWPDGGEELEALRAQALTWLARAADLAIGRYEIDDSLALLRRALELESDQLRQAELWRRIGLANALKFDGEAFWTAMQQSLDSSPDRELSAETYADLALQTALRSGSWRRRPPPELVQGWIEEALKLAAPGGAARAKSLIADCFWNRTAGVDAAQEANDIAERLGDVDLLEFSFAAHAWLAFAEREYQQALRWTERSLELVDAIGDPDHLADLYENAIPALCGVGKFTAARQLIDRHASVVDGLTPHHRLHNMAIRLELDEVCATWGDALAISERTVAAVDENLSTPCIRNARSLLVTALAAAETGDLNQADALEARAYEVALAGHDSVLASPRARLALMRGDVDAALTCLPELADPRMHWALANAATRLDTLVAAGARGELEREASLYLSRGSYTEPFALRALGIVRDDGHLVRKAEERFAVLGLGWHSDQTPVLIKLRQSAA
jgi:tetratricopeptide (TPR) repeat protein